MSAVLIEVGPSVEPALGRALAPVLAALRARTDLPAGAALAVGAPSAAGLGRLLEAPALVAVPAGVDPDDPYWRAVAERAGAVCDIDPPAPAGDPLTGVRPADPGDPRQGEVFSLLDGLDPAWSPGPTAVRLVSGRAVVGVLQAREAWAGGAAVVVLPGPAGEVLAPTGGALVAGTAVEAAEALVLLEGAPRLAMALADRGRASLAALARVDDAVYILAGALRRAGG